MARKTAYEKKRELELEQKRRNRLAMHEAWGDTRFRQGKSVISNINEYGSTVSTVVKFKRNGQPMTEVQRRDISIFNTPDKPPYWLRPEGPERDTAKRFKVGHVYETTTYYGAKERYAVTALDRSKQMATVQAWYGKDRLSDTKVRRKINFHGQGPDGIESIQVNKGIYSSMTRTWTGGYSIYSDKEVKGVTVEIPKTKPKTTGRKKQ